MAKRRAIAAVSGGLICVAVVTLVSPPTAMPDSNMDRPATLRVSAVNLFRSNSHPSEATRRLAGLDADLLVALEWTGDNLDIGSLVGSGLVPVLDEPRHGSHGVLVLARRPAAVEAALVRNRARAHCGRPIATVRVAFGGEWLSVLGVHSPPPNENCGANRASPTNILAELIDNGELQRDFGACHKGDPVIVAGDLNALPVFPTVQRLLDEGMVDTYAEQHWRPTGTWTGFPWAPGLARIDFILASRRLLTTGSWVVGLPGSDHCAVIADLKRAALDG